MLTNKPSICHSLVTILFFIPLQIYITSAIAKEKQEGIRGELSIQQSHTNKILSIDYAKNHNFFITGGQDSTVKVWQKDGKIIRTINVDFSPDHLKLFSNDQFIFAASRMGHVKIISLDGKKYLNLPRHLGMINDLAVAPNSSFYAIGTSSGKVITYKMNGEIIAELSLPPLKPTKRKVFKNATTSVQRVAVAPNSALISATNLYGELVIWNLDGEMLLHEKLSEAPITSMSYNKQGKLALAFGLPTGKIQNRTDLKLPAVIIDLANQGKIHNFKTPPLGEMAFSSNGDKLYALTQAKLDKSILVYDLKGQLLNSFVVDRGTNRTSASFDDKQFITVDAGINPSDLKIWSANGELIKSIKKPLDSIHDVAVSPNGQIIASGLHSNKVRLWSLQGKYVRSLYIGSSIYALAYSPDGKKLIVGSVKDIQVWDPITGEKLQTLTGQKYGVYGLDIHSSGNWFVAVGSGKLQVFKDIGGNYQLQTESTISKNGSNSVSISPENGQIAVAAGRRGVHVLDQQGSTLWKTPPLPSRDPNGNLLLASETCGLNYSQTGKWLAAMNADNTVIFDKSGNELATLPTGSGYNFCDVLFMNNDAWLITTAGKSIEIWDWKNRKLLAQYIGHKNKATSISHIPKTTLLISGSSDSQMRLWNLKTGYSAAVGLEKGEWIIYDDFGFFDASRGGGSIINFSKANKTHTADQFALYFNRPDIILSKLGLANQDYYKHLVEQYKRRINEAFAKEEYLSPDIAAPEISISGEKRLDDKLKLSISITDNVSDLATYQIYNNNVPLFGSKGKPITGNSAEIEVEINLVSGKNHIEATAFNQKGAESLRISTEEILNIKRPSNLYFVGLGVSKYKNNSLDLKYASKDVYDLSKVITEKYGGAQNVHTKLLTNEQVTKKSLKEIKKFLSKASIHDTVILFISGHGGYERNKLAEYYYLTYDAEPHSFTEKAISWSDIENILYSVKSNKKLLLMDTCESGEMDISNQIKALEVAKKNGFYSRASKILSDIKNKKKERRKYLYFKDRYIYNDIFRGSGAIVFSSSAGGEMSFESEKIENGFFTEALIAGLTSEAKIADKNGNGKVEINELVDFTSLRVGQQTQGLQNPTVDRGNPQQKLYFDI